MAAAITTPPSTNWGGNVAYGARRLHLPRTADEVVQLVRAGVRLKPLGTRHTFNRVADTDGDLVGLQRMNRVLSLDEDRQTVCVEAGVTYGALGAYLHARGYAPNNLPSLPHVCVAGAVATGTHGSGTANLAADVVALELVTADGQIHTFSRGDGGASFAGMVVSLGLLGVVTRLTLRVRRAFTVRQDVYEGVALTDVLDHYDALVACAYSVSLFTDWRREGRIDQVWLKHESDSDADDTPEPPFTFLRGTRARAKRHPVTEAPAKFCTEQGIAGPAHERLPHFSADGEPSSAGNELQTEYFVPRELAGDALRAVAAVGSQLSAHLMICEVRTVEADAQWLSPCYRRRSIAIHFTWRPAEVEVTRLLRSVLEPALAPFRPRPHWGKLFALAAAEVRSEYDALPAFRELCGHLDPTGKFRNAFSDDLLFVE